MKERPETASFIITSRCNNDCPHCFVRKGFNDMDPNKLNSTFDLFEKNGVKGVLLTGGEPLLRKDFEEIVQDLKARKMKIYLDTNCDYFSKHAEFITNNIDTIGLPIDFPNDSYRNKNNLGKVVSALEYMKSKEIRPKIRIGTTVTKDNFKILNNIGALIKNYPVDIWKIYEFVPMGDNASKNQEKMQITDIEFTEATKNLVTDYKKYFDVVISKRKDRSSAYFMVNPDGSICMPIDNSQRCEALIFGNITDEDISKKWKNLVAYEEYIENIKNTF